MQRINILFLLALFTFILTCNGWTRSIMPNKNMAISNILTIRGELSCGSGLCNIGDEYDIPYPVKGIDLFDFCQNGDDCEIKAVVDGNTIIEIVAAKKISEIQENVQTVNATQDQNNNENEFGLYGFTLNKDLKQILITAKNKDFDISTLEYPANAKDTNSIIELANSININIQVNKISETQFNQLYNGFMRGIGIKNGAEMFISDLKIDFLVMQFVREKIDIKILFFKGQHNIFYPFAISVVFQDHKYWDAAEQTIAKRADVKQNGELLQRIYIKNKLMCKCSNGGFLFFSTDLVDKFIETLNSYIKKYNEEQELKEKERNQELQKDM